ncbi:WhiB family transcriptional regulator (plasmid) [Microtetraspora malaysiensis]|uniref:WhiB family transcriptional regulator n=1 Tax=Microtetraspora malaysiensis TaxID=161358 RepID=UPI003D8EA546
MSTNQWRRRAACRGMDLELFFGPPEGQRGKTSSSREAREAEAKQVCASCPVKQECLDDQVSFGAFQYGIAAEMTGPERMRFRKRLLRQRRAAARRAAS